MWEEGASYYSVHVVVGWKSELTATEKETERPPIPPLSRAVCPVIASPRRMKIPVPSVRRQMVSYLYRSGTDIESGSGPPSWGLTKLFIYCHCCK